MIEAAAERYAEVMALDPVSVKSHHAAMKAAGCMKDAGNFAEAARFYQAIIAGVDARADKEPGTRRLRDWKCEALFKKAHACCQAGLADEALAMISLLREEFPDSVRATEIGILQAQLENRSTQPAQELFAQAGQAIALVRQAGDLQVNEDYNQALQLCDQVITSYPETAATWAALDLKGHILADKLKRPEQARAVFELILSRLGLACRRCRLVQDTRLHLRRLLLDRLQGKHGPAKPGSDPEWDNLRELCRQIIAQDPWAFGRVYGHLTLIEVHFAKGEPARALAAAQELIYIYEQGDKEDWKALKAHIAWAHLYAGRALQRMGLYDEALAHYRYIVDFIYDYPPYGHGSETRRHAYVDIWRTLRQAGAPQEEITQAAQMILSLFPDSPYVAEVHRKMQ